MYIAQTQHGAARLTVFALALSVLGELSMESFCGTCPQKSHILRIPQPLFGCRVSLLVAGVQGTQSTVSPPTFCATFGSPPKVATLRSRCYGDFKRTNLLLRRKVLFTALRKVTLFLYIFRKTVAFGAGDMV